MRDGYAQHVLERALPSMILAQPVLLDSGRFFVAESDGMDVVGCGGWSHESPGTWASHGGVGHVRHFATHPDWVRRGVGRALMCACMAQATSEGFHRLDCLSSLNAIDFYTALGFSRIAEIDIPIAGGGFTVMHMRRALR